MDNHEIAIGHNRPVLVLERRRQVFHQIEQSLAARRDVSAVLDVVRRLKLLGSPIVTFVEQRVERVQNEPFVLLTC